MKSCPSCGYKCDDSIDLCPVCGYYWRTEINREIEKTENGKRKRGRRITFIVVLAISCVLICFLYFKNLFSKSLQELISNKDTFALSIRIKLSKDDIDETIWGYTPLEYCIKEDGGLEIFNLLLKNGADPNHVTSDGHTPLSLAVRYSRPDYLVKLISYGADVNVTVSVTTSDSEEEVKIPLLEYAALFCDDGNIIKALIDGGADVNAEDPDGYTAIERCIKQNQNLEIISILAQNGADFSHVKGLFDTLCLAIKYDCSPQIISCLISNGADVNTGGIYSPLGLAISNNSDKEIFRILCEAGADLNAESFGMSLLMDAIDSNLESEKFRFLIEAGCDVNHSVENIVYVFYPWDYCSPLAYAIQQNDIEKAEILLEYGADPNYTLYYSIYDDDSTEIESVSLLSYAAVMNDDVSFAEKLIEYGADVNTENSSSNTALDECILCGNELDIIQLLVENGADLNHKNDSGYTPLMLAILDESSFDIVDYLASSPHDMEVKSSNGLSVLQIAVINKADLETIRSLILNGSDPSVTTKYGTSILELAKEYESEDVIKYLEKAVDLHGFAESHILDEAGVFTQKEKLTAAEKYYDFYRDYGIHLIFITAPSSVLLIDASKYRQEALDKNNADGLEGIIITVSPSFTQIAWYSRTNLSSEDFESVQNEVGEEYWKGEKYNALITFENMLRNIEQTTSSI